MHKKIDVHHISIYIYVHHISYYIYTYFSSLDFFAVSFLVYVASFFHQILSIVARFFARRCTWRMGSQEVVIGSPPFISHKYRPFGFGVHQPNLLGDLLTMVTITTEPGSPSCMILTSPSALCDVSSPSNPSRHPQWEDHEPRGFRPQQKWHQKTQTHNGWIQAVPILALSWRSPNVTNNPLKGHVFTHHPKKVTAWITRNLYFWFFCVFLIFWEICALNKSTSIEQKGN